MSSPATSPGGARPPRLLLLSASAGAGHVRAAQALEEAARARFPRGEVVHLDVLDLVGKAYRKAYAGSFLAMVNHSPALWGALYEAGDAGREGRVRERFVRFYDRLEFATFRKAVRGVGPDAVLSTHFLPAQVLSPYRRRGRDLFPLGLVVTDFDVHAFWVQPTADRYYVATEELAAVLALRGIEPERIAVTGIPIAAAFAAPRDRAALRAGLGIPAGLPAVLVMAGGAGVGAMRETVEAALAGPPVAVLAVAGKNAALKEEVERLPVPRGSVVRAFGFVETIADLMATADVAVTKSGGLTTSECLAMGLPMLVRDPIPGQEERNADFVVESGAGLRAQGPYRLRYRLASLLADPDRLRRMREAARAVGRPGAAAAVVDDAARTLLQRV